MIKNVLNSLIHLIYPPECVFCGKLTENGKMYCGSCIKYNPADHCHKCYNDWNNCQCEDMGEHVITPLEYSGIVRSKLIRLKTNNDTSLSKAFAELMFKSYCDSEAKLEGNTIIIPVPASKDRLKERGFNQSEILAYELSKLLKLEVNTEILARKNDSLTQHELDYDARFINAENSYYLAKHKNLEDTNVIIVDDIVTTGATLNACSTALKSCNPKNILSICVARTLKEGRI